MSDPIMFSISDALDLQALAGQRSIIEQQIASIINAYGVTGPASLVCDVKGRWIGIQAEAEPSKLELVKDDPEVEIESETQAVS